VHIQALEHPFLAPVRCSGVSSQISSKNENELVVGTEIPTQTSETTDNQPTAVIVGEPGPVLPASTITLISSVGSDSTSSVVNGEPEAMQNGAPEVQNETTQEELVAGCESLACKPVPSWFESFSDVAQSSCPVQMINVSEMQTLLSAECDDQVESTKDTERHNNIVEEQHNVEQKLWLEASKAWLESTARMFPPASLSGRIPSISISSVRNRVKAPI
jgi:hypothetical protein